MRGGSGNDRATADGAGPAAVDLSADLPTLLRGARLPLLRWAKSVRPDASPDVAALPLRADSAGGASPWTRLVVAFMAGGQVAGYISLVLPTGAPIRRRDWPCPGPDWPPPLRPCVPER